MVLTILNGESVPSMVASPRGPFYTVFKKLAKTHFTVAHLGLEGRLV